jgi:hypothetical protein
VRLRCAAPRDSSYTVSPDRDGTSETYLKQFFIRIVIVRAILSCDLSLSFIDSSPDFHLRLLTYLQFSPKAERREECCNISNACR